MQNPPPSEQSYVAPTGAPAPAAPRSGTGMDPKVSAAISYIWIVGVVFFFVEKENKFVRFHAMQSILFGIVNTVIMIVLLVIAFILTFAFGIGGVLVGATVGGGLGTLVSMMVWVTWLLFWAIMMVLIFGLIFAAVKAYQGQKFKLPIIGNIAESIVEK